MRKQPIRYTADLIFTNVKGGEGNITAASASGQIFFARPTSALRAAKHSLPEIFDLTHQPNARRGRKVRVDIRCWTGKARNSSLDGVKIETVEQHTI